MSKAFPLLAFALLSVSLRPAAQSALGNHDQAVTEMYAPVVEYREDLRSLLRYYDTPYSASRRERLRRFYEDRLARIDAMPFDSFSTGGRVDLILLRRKIREDLLSLQREEAIHAQIAEWVGPGNYLDTLALLRQRGKALDGEAVAARLDDIRRQYLAHRPVAKEGKPLPPEHIRQLRATLDGQRKALKGITEFYGGYDPLFSWWVKRPSADLDSCLADQSKFWDARQDTGLLSPDDGSGIVGERTGPAELERLLRGEMIPYTSAELIKIAEREFAWCDKEMLKASRELGYGTDWKAALEHVKQTYVPPGGQPEAMLALYTESVNFLKQHDLLTIPPLAEETWRMRMIEPERQRISPFFLGGEVLQISYPTDDMTHAEKLMSMRGNNPHFSRATVHHELIAGHHLQQFMNARHKSYRSFDTPFWTEGWALYWEILLWDLGFAQSPEDRIGMLFWRMHRCARILFSVHYHRGEWTPQQCIDFLVDRVGHERANAEGEVRRSVTGGYGPLYQLAYLIGGLQFKALKEELVDSGKMTYKTFHDAVLRENNIPVEMLRAILTGQDLPRAFETTWRFYTLP